MTAVTIDDVTIAFGERVVVDHVSLAIAEGEWVALIGPNGAGKTTLLRAITGQSKGTGRVCLGDQEVRGLDVRALARQVALVPQNPLVPPGMSVNDYVLLGRTPHLGAFAAEGPGDRAIVHEQLMRLDLAGFGPRELTTLSGGELQRVVLARALAQQAPVLLLDEPTSALDIGHQQQVLELVDELRVADGLTVLSAMHDLNLAGQHADRLVLLAAGRVVEDGPAAQVLTVEHLAEHYGASVRVMHLDDGSVIVVPLRPNSRRETGRGSK